jgi:hypothetical protein
MRSFPGFAGFAGKKIVAGTLRVPATLKAKDYFPAKPILPGNIRSARLRLDSARGAGNTVRYQVEPGNERKTGG